MYGTCRVCGLSELRVSRQALSNFASSLADEDNDNASSKLLLPWRLSDSDSESELIAPAYILKRKKNHIYAIQCILYTIYIAEFTKNDETIKYASPFPLNFTILFAFEVMHFTWDNFCMYSQIIEVYIYILIQAY